MALQWHELRSWNGSQDNAFEELCCQLARQESPADASHFERKAAPDAGVECYWVLKDGSEWGWQAKFFLFSLGDSQWRQLDESVETALMAHPRLTQYFVCLPQDRSDPRIPGRKSKGARWKERVEKWRKLPGGQKVEFKYWGTSEIFDRLTQDRNVGREKFWFDGNRFSDEWFKRKIRDAVVQAGDRYTPQLNVDLPISSLFEGLGATPAYWKRLRRQLVALRDIASERLRYSFRGELAGINEKLENEIGLFVAESNLIRETSDSRLSLKALGVAIEAVEESLYDAWRKVEEADERARAKVKEETGKEIGRFENSETSDAWRSLAKIREVTSEALEFIRGNESQLAQSKTLLVTGDAGSGKTHLFCDVAESRLAAGFPTVLLFGEQFATGIPGTTIAGILGQNDSVDDFFAILDAAGESRRCKVLLCIDALNEGEGLQIWNNHLGSFLSSVSDYRHIAVALSVRSTYRSLVIRETPWLKQNLVEVEHRGFSDHEFAAARRFFGFYKLKLPGFPTISPEFSNPLFLKVLCSALYESGYSEIPPGVSGSTAVFSLFLSGINTKLAHPSHLDYDEAECLVQKAVAEIAATMAAARSAVVSVEDARSMCERLLPGRSYDRSLLRHLQAEGVLTRYHANWGERSEFVRFTYQRFSDHLIARQLLSGIGDEGSPTRLTELVQSIAKQGAQRGVLEALAIQLPELHAAELPDLLAIKPAEWAIRRAFLQSVVWRNPKAVTRRTRECINEGDVFGERGYDATVDVFVTVATHPGHPFNADFLHAHLAKKTMPDRDAAWSTYLHRAHQEGSDVMRFIHWAWHEEDRSHLSDESVRLAATALLWFCTTSNRFVRDKATKALVSLLENRVQVIRMLLEKFWSVNDPYVTERLMAVAYGCALRTRQDGELTQMARDVYDRTFRESRPPVSLLLRDHARGLVLEAMRRDPSLKWKPATLLPPFRSKWISKLPGFEELKRRYEKGSSGSSWALRTIYSSVMDGDFSSYVIRSYFDWTGTRIRSRARKVSMTVEEFVARLPASLKDLADFYVQNLRSAIRRGSGNRNPAADPKTKNLVRQIESVIRNTLKPEMDRLFMGTIRRQLLKPVATKESEFDRTLMQRWILSRVLDLGWTTDRFGKFDDNVPDRYGRDAHKAERIGKKYQWIAYDEFLARCSDHFTLKREDYVNSEAMMAAGSWMTHYRDIDPSLLIASTPQVYDGEEPCWWINQQFNSWHTKTTPLGWLQHADDFVDIPKLVKVQSSDGRRWIVLQVSRKWKQGEALGRIGMSRPDSREVWVLVRGFLVASAHFSSVMTWAKDFDFNDARLNGPDHWSNIHFCEHFWHPALRAMQQDDWEQPNGYGGNWPHPIMPAAVQYYCEDSTYDCSIEKSVMPYLPCRSIFEGMGLHWRGRGATAHDSDGQLIAWDPSAMEAGPSALLVDEDKFAVFLKKKGLRLFFGVCGEKNIYGRETFSQRDDWWGRLNLSGAFALGADGKIEGNLSSDFTPGTRKS